MIIRHLEATRALGMPYAKVLKENCEGLLELRATVNNIQYRPIAYYGPGEREVTLLVPATEVNSRFVPLSACATAYMRIEEIRVGRASTRDHDFS